ncbi:hypothetical protein ACFXKW_00995 [Streptomyces sp. NPDC059193]|uniref:hypothetical protein n=1 Tax=Streptomyces sp. NPDC059193 TaxID=3346763 RepID=UPI0036B5FF56
MTETSPEAARLRTAAPHRTSSTPLPSPASSGPPGRMVQGPVGRTSFERARRLLEDAGNDWVTAKEMYGGSGGSADRMREVFFYRKLLIDSMLLRLRARYPHLRIRSVGSNNPTSDYDITVSGAGAAAAVALFNAEFRAEWGKESATVFDVNLYVKDFMPERGNFAFPYVPGTEGLRWQETELLVGGGRERLRPRHWTPRTDGGWEGVGARTLSAEAPDPQGIVEPGGAMAREMAEADQDVAALSKLRKYLTAEQWRAYVERLTGLLPAPAAEVARVRHATADAVHRRAVRELAGRLRTETGQVRPATHDEAYIEDLEHSSPDVVIRARNLIYSELAGRLGEAQQQFAADPSDDLALRIRRDTSYSLWHAMEAYHSQGAVLDVVGKQAGSAVSVSGAHYLQSFNEQLGDLLKDLRHYTDAGEAFYRSAKYLQRMTAAARRVLETSGAGLAEGDLSLLAKLEEISSADGTLLALRGGKGEYETTSAADRSDIAAGVYRDALAIDDHEGLLRCVLELSARVNAALRGAQQG